MAPEQQHFLLVPYSELGHINPMLSVASQLLRLGCRVTFVKADRHLPTTTSDASNVQPEPRTAASNAIDGVAHERLRFVTLPVRNSALCVDPKTMTRYQIFKTTMAGLEDRQDLVAAIAEESKASSYPITCIISDSFIWKWVRHIARAHHLHSAVLCITGALNFYLFYLGANGRDEESEELLVSKFGMPSMRDNAAYSGILNLNESAELRLQKTKFFFSLVEGIEEVETVFINSFEALEAPLVPALQASGFDVRFIGPCLQELHKDDVGMKSSMTQTGSIFVEDTTCLTWLDDQEDGSILFVAFGSEVEIDAKQVEEIELGIRKSGYKFLWVVRPSLLVDNTTIRSMFEQSNGQGKGMFVSWAPQVRVLQHPAVGGFLTHSGWSSTLESLTFGVPMLCLPMGLDHAFIANFVQNHLQVGIRLSVTNDGLVHKEEVLKGVQAIMQGCFSRKVSQLQELAQLAIQTAHLQFTSFLQAID